MTHVFSHLSPSQRWGVRCLRVTHFLLARSGLLQAICLLSLLGERASREKEPPIHSWIVYSHAILFLLTSTGLSSRMLSRLSVFTFVGLELHSTYLFMFADNLKYQIWLRMRSAVRSLAVAGASLRLLSANDFSSRSWVDRLGCGFIGIVCGILGILSLPNNVSQVDQVAQNHEHLSVFKMFNCYLLQLIIGSFFLIAFVAYTFPMVISMPSTISSSASNDEKLSALVRMADKCAVVAWLLILVTRDLNWQYWHRSGVDFWLWIRFLIDDVTVIASIIIGWSLPWLGQVTDATKQSRDKKNA